MSSFLLYLAIFLLKFNQVYSIPTCIIIDTNMIQGSEDRTSLPKNHSILLRNLRMLDHQRSSSLPEFSIESIPLSYIDTKQTPSPSLNNIFRKSLTDSLVDETYFPCSLEVLNKLETQMLVPFEFRRLRIEQPDHYTKFLDDTRETVPDLSTAVYERRSDPEGIRFCRTCHDGKALILYKTRKFLFSYRSLE